MHDPRPLAPLAGRRVALIATGVGVTPLRALLEDPPACDDPVVLLRASSEEELPLANEVMELARGRGGRGCADPAARRELRRLKPHAEK
ncbi:MAG: hypothetical protein WAN22_10535 [Solirubrobacteraceae bacterium]